jgi:hypothetical protein
MKISRYCPFKRPDRTLYNKITSASAFKNFYKAIMALLLGGKYAKFVLGAPVSDLDPHGSGFE